MKRRTLAVVLVATLAVLAVAFAAATLSSTVTTEASGVGGNESSEGVINIQETTPQETTGSSITVPTHIRYAIGAVLAVGFLLSAVYAVRHWREYLGHLAGVLALGLFVYALMMVDFDFASLLSGDGRDGAFGGDLFGDGQGSNVGSISTIGYEVLGLVGVLVFALIVYRLQFGADGDADRGSETETAAEAATGASRFETGVNGRDISDRDLDESAENEVYRAWNAMTAGLDVSDPESTTPREFASAAVDAGMDPADVNDLTHLFEDVRYGGHDPTDDHEQRAREIRERIETATDEA